MANDSEESEEQRGGLPEGQALLEWLRPRPEIVTLLRELRRDPVTRAILDRNRSVMELAEKDAVIGGKLQPRPTTTSADVTPVENNSGVLQLVVDYANGMTQVEIARKYGVHVQTVRKRLKEAGVVVRGNSRALTDSDLREVRGLLDAGLSAREVAGRYGVAHTTLLRALRRTDTSDIE